MLVPLLLLLAGAGTSSAQHGATLADRQKLNYTAYTFNQPIDHFSKSDRYVPHTTATFKQRYFVDQSYYKEGGPVFLYIGGETSGESRFSNLRTGIIQILMEATNGVGVILENRYYGESFPFNTSTTDDLRFLTTEQSIADNAYFAQHASLPGLGDLNAPGTPWILYGGSLAGFQTAASLKTYGGDKGILWGGIASSGTTKAVLEYPQWYDPYFKYAPQDCIGSLVNIVKNINSIFDSGNAEAIHKVKDVFGLAGLKDNRDFAMAIAYPLGGPMNYPSATWQELNWNPSSGANDVFEFCHNVTNDQAPPSVKQVDKALSQYTHGKPWKNLGNYAAYVKRVTIPQCIEDVNIDSTQPCSTQNISYWADASNSGGRSYLYSTCSEAGIYQVSKKTGPSLLVNMDTDYTQQWCTWAFPAGKHNKIPPTPELEQINTYGGYNVVADRLAHIDGEQDVWNPLCYHSPEAGPRYTLDEEDAHLHPQMLITGAGHHWDSTGIVNVTAEPQFIREAHLWEIRIVKQWLRDCEYPLSVTVETG